MEKNVELTKLQEKLLEMYDAFVEVIEKKNMDVYLVGGTALGAVRHQGFIPWDDDMDVAMLRPEFEQMERWMKMHGNRIGDFVYLPAENDIHSEAPVGHLYDGNLIEKYGYDCVAQIDIHPLDGIPKQRFLQRIQQIAAKGYYLFVYNHPTKNKGKAMRVISGMVLALTPAFLRHIYLRVLKKMITSWDTGKSKYICSLFGEAGYRREIIAKSDILPARNIVFSGREYKTFAKVEKYLKQRYGNYMELPPKHERVPLHKANQSYN